MGRGVVWLAAVAGALATMVVPPAQAAFPGENGKIAFERARFGTHVFVVSPDGTGLTQISSLSPSRAPEWSPDGLRLAFAQQNSVVITDPNGGNVQTLLTWPDEVGRLAWSPDGGLLALELRVCDSEGECRFDIHTVSVHGTDLTNITPDLIGDRNPSWSPDGTKIAFDSSKDGNGLDLYTVEPDGTNLERLTTSVRPETDPDWSPDGQEIAFVMPDENSDPDIWRMKLDGSETTALTPSVGGFPDADPAWSPDGQRIVWTRVTGGGTPQALMSMRSSDGGDVQQITTNPDAIDLAPDWQVVPLPGYPRPKGASPVDVSLVPAYEACTAPNRIHGPPLEHPSCAPPQRVPGQLTVGTADSNGQPTKSVSRVRFGVLAGKPATPEDEADVRLSGTVNDVRLASDLSDYTGELRVNVVVRITDRDNTPDQDGPAATVHAFRFFFDVPCGATADSTTGGDCTFDTTAEAITPGAVKELQRSVWELKTVRVNDADDHLFMTQGIFVP